MSLGLTILSWDSLKFSNFKILTMMELPKIFRNIYKIPTKHVGLVQSRHHHHFIEIQVVLAKVLLKNSSLGVEQQSLPQSLTIQHLSS
jgi:hypothetical protein